MNRIIKQSDRAVVMNVKDEYGGIVDAVMLRKHNLRAIVGLV